MGCCLIRLNENEHVIVSDFDGTITKEDSNALLGEVRGNAENAQIEVDFLSGLMSNREALERHFEVMRITLREYEDFIKTNIRIDPYFDAFLKQVQLRAIPFFIVSAGFRQAVECVLGNEQHRDAEVYANDLQGEPYIKPIFATKKLSCDKPVGPCGNCKRDCLTAIRRKSGKKILYIGDGITDRCAIEEADIVLAKESLAKYCDAQGVPYTLYENFADVIDLLGWSAGTG